MIPQYMLLKGLPDLTRNTIRNRKYNTVNNYKQVSMHYCIPLIYYRKRLNFRGVLIFVFFVDEKHKIIIQRCTHARFNQWRLAHVVVAVWLLGSVSAVLAPGLAGLVGIVIRQGRVLVRIFQLLTDPWGLAFKLTFSTQMLSQTSLMI